MFIILLEIRYMCYSRLSCSRGYNNVLFSCTSFYFSKSYFFLRYPTSLNWEPFIKKQLPYHLSYHGTNQEGAQVSEIQGYTGRLQTFFFTCFFSKYFLVLLRLSRLKIYLAILTQFLKMLHPPLTYNCHQQ